MKTKIVSQGDSFTVCRRNGLFFSDLDTLITEKGNGREKFLTLCIHGIPSGDTAITAAVLTNNPGNAPGGMLYLELHNKLREQFEDSYDLPRLRKMEKAVKALLDKIDGVNTLETPAADNIIKRLFAVVAEEF